MRNILWLNGFGINSTYPNSICNKNIISALKNQTDISIDIVCDGIVEEIPERDWKRNSVYMIRRIIKWPSCNPDVETVCRRQLLSILKMRKYDCIFVPHKPFETVFSACKIKKKYPDIKVFIYSLDPIANEVDANNGLGKYLFFLSEKAERKVFQTADHIFHMECNRSKYAGNKYKKFIDKFSYLDFPLIESASNKECQGKDYLGDTIKMIYTGLLNNTYRSPDYFLNLYKIVKKKIPIELHFYSKGNSVLKIEKKAQYDSSIKSYGYIPKSELDEKIEEADYLINIGNKFSSMLPSKILTYFMTGKPIVHIKNQDNDACIKYLEKYTLFIVIDEKDSIETNAEKLIKFLKENYKKRLSSNFIETTFKKNTPEWNAKQILKVLAGDSGNDY